MSLASLQLAIARLLLVGGWSMEWSIDRFLKIANTFDTVPVIKKLGNFRTSYER